jgi:hypothetical protein
MAGQGESDEAKQLEKEHEEKKAEFYKAIIPLWINLRMKGYQYQDLTG